MQKRALAVGIVAVCVIFGGASLLNAEASAESTRVDRISTQSDAVRESNSVTSTRSAVTHAAPKTVIAGHTAAPVITTNAVTMQPAPATRAPQAHSGELDVQSLTKESATNLELLATLEQKLGSVPPTVQELLSMQRNGASPDELELWAREHLPRELLLRAAVGRWIGNLRGRTTVNTESTLGPKGSNNRIGKLVAR